MKKIITGIFVIITTAASLHLQAQIKPTGGFGGPIITIGQIGDDAALTIGGGGGVILNSRFMIGGFGEGTATAPNPNDKTLDKHYLETSSGGFWLGYTERIASKHHVSVSALVGFGKVYLLRNAHESYYDNIAYIRPILEYEYRFNKIVGVAVGVAWPLYADFEIPYYEPKDLSNPAASITLKFGWLQ